MVNITSMNTICHVEQIVVEASRDVPRGVRYIAQEGTRNKKPSEVICHVEHQCSSRVK
jgi:hypothetical protein